MSIQWMAIGIVLVVAGVSGCAKAEQQPSPAAAGRSDLPEPDSDQEGGVGSPAGPDGGAPELECSVRHLDAIEGFALRGCAWFRAADGYPSEIGDLPPMAEVVGSATCVESEERARELADEFVAAHPPADDTYTGYEFASVRRQGSMFRVRYDKVFRPGVRTEPHHCEVVVEPDGAIHWKIVH